MAELDPNRLAAFDDNGETKPPLIGISLLPSAATLGNLLSGLVAVLCCLLSIRAAYTPFEPQTVHPHLQGFFPSYLAIGCYLIVLAMLFDALDGRLARLTRRTSEFGSQLDSLADIVSFGAAPALLLLTMLLRLSRPAEGPAVVSAIEWRLGLLCGLVYVSCAAIRLARYNAENVQADVAQKKFSGLPVPGAAGGLVALVLLHEDLFYSVDGAAAWAGAVRWVMLPAAFGLGLLMISRLDYVHVFNVYVRREHPPSRLVWLVVFVALLWYWPQGFLTGLAYAYVVSGLVLNAVHWRTARTTSRGLQSARRSDTA